MNKVILIGRLAKDCDVRYTNGGKTVCQFTIAVDKPFKNEEGKKEADFIPVVIWGNSAEYVGNNVSKGKRIAVEGRLQVRSYENKEGKNVYITEVIANNVEIIDWNDREAMNTNSAEPKGFESFGDEEIPF